MWLLLPIKLRPGWNTYTLEGAAIIAALKEGGWRGRFWEKYPQEGDPPQEGEGRKEGGPLGGGGGKIISLPASKLARRG